MGKNRDDFTVATKAIMAQRVAYKCSRPDCRNPTVGPNSIETKSTLVGEAAHIRAASPGGPRYDSSLSEEERSHINNGIWLCPRCATIIDKDPDKFPKDLLEDWKQKSEKMAWDELMIETPSATIIKPRLEVDLIWSRGGKINRGIDFNMTKELYSGPIHPNQAIYHNELFWKFKFSIYNNSSVAAINIQVEPLEGEEFFTYIDKLPRVNNIPPLGNIDVEAKYTKFLDSTGREAMQIIEDDIPKELQGAKFKLTYQDVFRNNHQVIVTLSEDGLKNEFVE